MENDLMSLHWMSGFHFHQKYSLQRLFSYDLQLPIKALCSIITEYTYTETISSEWYVLHHVLLIVHPAQSPLALHSKNNSRYAIQPNASCCWYLYISNERFMCIYYTCQIKTFSFQYSKRTSSKHFLKSWLNTERFALSIAAGERVNIYFHWDHL